METLNLQTLVSGTAQALMEASASDYYQRVFKTLSKQLLVYDWYAIITELSVFEGGVELIHEYSKPYEDYDPAMTQKKINHFLESGIRPMTCSTIGEKGFKCPKMVSGEGTCKATAAICYVPMSLDVLRDIIANLPVTDKALDNMQTANGFMEECLYNQDNVIAETVINTELKDHFKFTVSSLKPLIARYKELSKAYQQGLKARIHKVEHELPMWYSPTDHGLKFLPRVLAEHTAEYYSTIQLNVSYDPEADAEMLRYADEKNGGDSDE